jgi:hypothetical protein
MLYIHFFTAKRWKRTDITSFKTVKMFFKYAVTNMADGELIMKRII